MSPHTTAELTLDAQLVVRIWGEHMTAVELAAVIEAEHETIKAAVATALHCREIEVGWTPAGDRAAFLTEILDVNVAEVGALHVEVIRP